MGLGHLAANLNSPSRSLAPVLGGTRIAWDEEIFIEQEEVRAIHTRNWLYMKRFKGSEMHQFQDEMYDLVHDPAEKNNIAAHSEHADVAASLSARMDAFFHQYTDQKYDLWQGGTTKSNSGIPHLWKDAWGEDWEPVFV